MKMRRSTFYLGSWTWEKVKHESLQREHDNPNGCVNHRGGYHSSCTVVKTWSNHTKTQWPTEPLPSCSCRWWATIMKNIQKPQLSNFLQTLICETMDCTSLTELKCFYHEAAKWSLLNAFATLISKKHIVNLLEVFQDKLTRPSLETTTPLVSNYWACHPPKIKIKNPQTPLSEFNPVKKINSYIFLIIFFWLFHKSLL